MVAADYTSEVPPKVDFFDEENVNLKFKISSLFFRHECKGIPRNYLFNKKTICFYKEKTIFAPQKILSPK